MELGLSYVRALGVGPAAETGAAVLRVYSATDLVSCTQTFNLELEANNITYRQYSPSEATAIGIQ